MYTIGHIFTWYRNQVLESITYVTTICIDLKLDSTREHASVLER